MKRKIVVAVAFVFILGFAAASLFNSHSEYYEKYEKYKYGFIPYYSTIDKKCSEKDRETAQVIINLAGEIMTSLGEKQWENGGELEQYSDLDIIKEKQITRAEADIKLITADFTFSNGYMWVEIGRQSFDDGDVIVDEYNALAYWKLKKQNGQWTVTKIKNAVDAVQQKL